MLVGLGLFFISLPITLPLFVIGAILLGILKTIDFFHSRRQQNKNEPIEALEVEPLSD